MEWSKRIPRWVVLTAIWAALAGSITACVLVLLPAPTVGRTVVFIVGAAVWNVQAVVAGFRLVRSIMVVALVAAAALWSLLAWGLERPVEDNAWLILVAASLQLAATFGANRYRRSSFRRRFGRELSPKQEQLLVLAEDPLLRRRRKGS